VSASSLAAVKAARGGLDGGEGSPEEGTSGKPLCPVGPRSGVMEAFQGCRGVNRIAAGEDGAIITTTTVGGLVERHCD